MAPNYYPSQEQVVETGMKAALRDILQKGVLQWVRMCIHVVFNFI